MLMGWVNRRRDLGNLIFVDLRDRSGVTQVVFNEERDAAIHEKASGLRNEYVHVYFHDTDLLDRRRAAAVRVCLSLLGRRRGRDDLDRLAARLREIQVPLLKAWD